MRPDFQTLVQVLILVKRDMLAQLMGIIISPALFSIPVYPMIPIHPACQSCRSRLRGCFRYRSPWLGLLALVYASQTA